MSDRQEDPEDGKWSYEQNRSVAERAHDHETDFGNRSNEFAITSSNHALRALVLINGGAAIATLAFIGQVISADNVKIVPKLSEVTAPLLWFAWGVASAVLSIAFAYFTNYSIATASFKKTRDYTHPFVRGTRSSKRWTGLAVIFQLLAIVAAFLSLAFFVYGMFEVREAVSVWDELM